LSTDVSAEHHTRRRENLKSHIKNKSSRKDRTQAILAANAFSMKRCKLNTEMLLESLNTGSEISLTSNYRLQKKSGETCGKMGKPGQKGYLLFSLKTLKTCSRWINCAYTSRCIERINGSHVRQGYRSETGRPLKKMKPS
jgi:hypothetical protein